MTPAASGTFLKIVSFLNVFEPLVRSLPRSVFGVIRNRSGRLESLKGEVVGRRLKRQRSLCIHCDFRIPVWNLIPLGAFLSLVESVTDGLGPEAKLNPVK